MWYSQGGIFMGNMGTKIVPNPPNVVSFIVGYTAISVEMSQKNPADSHKAEIISHPGY